MQANLILPIERAIAAHIYFVGGTPTRAGIEMLIRHLELSLEAYPEAKEEIKNTEEQVNSVVLATQSPATP